MLACFVVVFKLCLTIAELSDHSIIANSFTANDFFTCLKQYFIKPKEYTFQLLKRIPGYLVLDHIANR